MMILDSKKTAQTLKPWWDTISFCLSIASLFIVLVIFTSSLGQDQIVTFKSNDVYLSTSSNGSSFDPAATSAFYNKMNDPEDPEVSDVPEFEPEEDNVFSLSFLISMTGVLFVLILFEIAYERTFYSYHFLQTLTHILDVLSDVTSFRVQSSTLIFSTSLHHSTQKRLIRNIFDIHNIFRLISTTSMLIVTIINFVSITSKASKVSDPIHHSGGILLLLLLSIQNILQVYATVWPWQNENSLWGRLMKTYTRTVEKLDIIRGRSVPSPPFTRRRDRAQVLDNLNPYAANANLRLVLDLIAYKNGIGLALKCLAFLEKDVHNNWKPHRLSISEEKNSMVIKWRDPLAVMYLQPVPKELSLYFGIEMTFPENHDLDNVNELVGYEDNRYLQQIWRAADPGNVEFNPKDIEYRETFEDVPQDVPIIVEVWTIIDGHFIAKETLFLNENCGRKAYAAPMLIQKQDQRRLLNDVEVEHHHDMEDSSSSQDSLDMNIRQDRLDSKAGLSAKELITTPAESSTFGSTYLDDQPSGEACFNAAANYIKARSVSSLVDQKIPRKIWKKSKSCSSNISLDHLNNGSESVRPTMTTQASSGFENRGFQEDEGSSLKRFSSQVEHLI